jgi:hypothetical protein
MVMIVNTANATTAKTAKVMSVTAVILKALLDQRRR